MAFREYHSSAKASSLLRAVMYLGAISRGCVLMMETLRRRSPCRVPCLSDPLMTPCVNANLVSIGDSPERLERPVKHVAADVEPDPSQRARDYLGAQRLRSQCRCELLLLEEVIQRVMGVVHRLYDHQQSGSIAL
jgi:hypothetical protein